MKDIIALLIEMGATKVEYYESESGWESESISFEYKGKQAEIYGIPCNTQEAALGGGVTTSTLPTTSNDLAE